MKFRLGFVTAIALAATVVAAQDKQLPLLSAEDVITLPRVSDPQISPDGNTVAYVVGEPSFEANRVTSHIWAVPFGGGDPKQLTNGNGESEPRWSPDGKLIAYVARKDGVPQVHVMNADGSGARAVTSLSTGAGGIAWSPDGSSILFASDVWPGLADDAAQRARAEEIEKSGVKAMIFDGLLYRHWNAFNEGRRPQLFVVAVAGGPARQLTTESRDAPPFSLGGPPAYAWSADSKGVHYTRGPEASVEAWSTNADLCVIPVEGGTPKVITAANVGWDGSPAVSPDGKWVAYRSQARDGYESDLFRLMLLDTTTGAIRRLAATLADSVEELAWTPNGTLIVGCQQAGSHAWFEVPIDGTDPHSLWTGPNAYSLTLSADGKHAAVSHASLVKPPEVFGFDRDLRAFRKLTKHTDALIADRRMPMHESMTWKGALGATIQGFLVKPPDFDPARQYPMIVFIHGGPQGAWMDAWSTRWNPAIYASAGYVVFAPNPHGSTGFGQPFCEQISGDWAGAVYEDIQRGVDAVIGLGSIDARRLGAAGGSYGGYMVNWILGHDHRFKALVSHAGVYNLESMYGSTEEIWFPEWEFKGPPWEQPELYQRWSPHRYAAAFKTPTLVIHGELDYRVPVAQGMELFTALKRRGVPSRFLYYPDEGHWVLKPRNARLWNATVREWFDRWLKQ